MWCLNVFMYLSWIFAPVQYQAQVNAGWQPYYWDGPGQPTSTMPTYAQIRRETPRRAMR
jgi:hypothetical protein